MFDPNAPKGVFVHWILFNIPNTTTAVVTGNEGVKGMNDFNNLGYGGPSPPKGETHTYFIRVFALNKKLVLNEGARLGSILRNVKGHVLAYGEIIGKYKG